MKVYIYYDPNLLMCVKKTERIYVNSLFKEVAEYIFLGVIFSIFQ